MRWKANVLHFTCIGIVVFAVIGVPLPSRAQQSPSAGSSSPSALQKTPADRVATSEVGNLAESRNLPNSPGAVALEAQQSQASPSQQATLRSPFDSQAAFTSQGQQAQSVQPGTAQSEPQQQQQQSATPPVPVQQPVGTAAAGTPLASGIAASQPAGIAIAPAKQHRVRTIVLRTGAIIGAAVAVGTVIALTEATPSKPPGAH
jgi:hypothetical protein